MEKDFRCNIVALGKTGAGKSTLLNYLFDTTFKADAGKPQTGQGLFECDAEINGYKVRLFDSWGIEADKVNEWDNLLKGEAQKHGAAKNLTDWFHSVVYCIQAGGSRVEPIDTRIIADFVKQGYKVVVALTKIDQISEDDETKMKDAIIEGVKEQLDKQDVALTVVSVCSEKKQTRMGTTRPQGRDELIDAILSSWVESVKQRIPIAVVERLCKHLDNFKGERLEKLINEGDVSGRKEGNDRLAQKLQEEIKQKMNELTEKTVQDETNDLLKQCYDIGYQLQGTFGNITLSAI